MNIRNRQPEGIPIGGQFAVTPHAEAGTVTLPAPPTTLHRALGAAIRDYEARAERLEEVDDLMDMEECLGPRPDEEARHAAYLETASRLRLLQEAGLPEGELAAAMEMFGQELRFRGDTARLAGRRDAYAGIGTELLITTFDNRDPDAQLERRRAKIKDLNGLQFEDAELPRGQAVDRYIARLKLSGITGTVRRMQAGADSKELTATVETPEGRSYDLQMTYSTLDISRSEDPEGSPAVRVNMGRGEPVTPELLRDAFREAAGHAVLADAWAGNTSMRSSPPGVHPEVSFTDLAVYEDTENRVAAVTARNSIGTYRVERRRSKATGEAETRIQVLGTEASKVSERMTEAILADLSEAGGGEGTGAAFTRDLDRFAEAAAADPAYNGR